MSGPPSAAQPAAAGVTAQTTAAPDVSHAEGVAVDVDVGGPENDGNNLEVCGKHSPGGCRTHAIGSLTCLSHAMVSDNGVAPACVLLGAKTAPSYA